MPLFVDEKGNRNGQTIVFIHGGGMSGWMWQKQWEAFEDFHMLFPDLPDHGKSSDEGRIDIRDGAERIAVLIRERANGGRAHVVGHSLGGKIIVELLGACPEVIDRAVVASALFRPMPLFDLALNMPVYKLTLWMLRYPSILAAQMKNFNFPNDFYKDHFMRETAAQTPEMLDRIYSQLNRYQALPTGLGQAHVPTLVIAGEKEPKAMRLSATDIAGSLPDARTCLIKGALHNFPWAHHEAFNAAIRAWLTRAEIPYQNMITL